MPAFIPYVVPAGTTYFSTPSLEAHFRDYQQIFLVQDTTPAFYLGRSWLVALMLFEGLHSNTLTEYLIPDTCQPLNDDENTTPFTVNSTVRMKDIAPVLAGATVKVVVPHCKQPDRDGSHTTLITPDDEHFMWVSPRWIDLGQQEIENLIRRMKGYVQEHDPYNTEILRVIDGMHGLMKSLVDMKVRFDADVAFQPSDAAFQPADLPDLGAALFGDNSMDDVEWRDYTNRPRKRPQAATRDLSELGIMDDGAPDCPACWMPRVSCDCGGWARRCLNDGAALRESIPADIQNFVNNLSFPIRFLDLRRVCIVFENKLSAYHVDMNREQVRADILAALGIETSSVSDFFDDANVSYETLAHLMLNRDETGKVDVVRESLEGFMPVMILDVQPVSILMTGDAVPEAVDGDIMNFLRDLNDALADLDDEEGDTQDRIETWLSEHPDENVVTEIAELVRAEIDNLNDLAQEESDLGAYLENFSSRHLSLLRSFGFPVDDYLETEIEDGLAGEDEEPLDKHWHTGSEDDPSPYRLDG